MMRTKHFRSRGLILLGVFCILLAGDLFARAWNEADSGGSIEAKSEPLRSRVLLTDLFEEPKFKRNDIPVTGQAHPAFNKLDKKLKCFMVDRGIGALSVAICWKGNLLYQRAFGWANSDMKRPLSVDTRMRMASVTKPVVAAAIKTLFTSGALDPDALVYDLLNLDQYTESKSADARWQKVTIQELLDHKGGWENDFTFDTTAICKVCRIDMDELTSEHVVRYALTQPMEFEPGAKKVYSNLGYILLVRVVEKVSAIDFIAFLKRTIGEKSKTSAWNWSTADAKERNPEEGWYIYHPEYPTPEYPLPARIESRAGAGALACTPTEYCRFLETYWISGDLRDKRRVSYTFFGSYPGVTSTVAQRGDGFNFAAFANRRDKAGYDWNNDLAAILTKAIDHSKKKLMAK